MKSIDNFKEYQVRPASNPSFSDLHMRAGRRQSFFEMEYDARQPMNVNIINLSRRPPPYSRRNDSIQDFFMIRTDQSRPYPHPAHLGHPHHPAIVAPPLRRMAVEEESNEPIVLVADHQPVSEVVVSNSPPILIDHNREDISVSAANSNGELN